MPSDWTLLKEELGSGGYGKVVRARRNTDGKEAAAKIVSKRRMKLSAIQKEVQLMEMLSHPNIIAMYAAEEVSDNYYIYMELATGGELFGKVIASGALSEDEARPHFVELMSAVQYMHSMGVVHRDLKLVCWHANHLRHCGIALVTRDELTSTLSFSLCAGECPS